MIQDYDYFDGPPQSDPSKNELTRSRSTTQNTLQLNLEFKETDEEVKSNTFVQQIPLNQKLLSQDLNNLLQPKVNSFLSQKRLGDLVRQSIKHSKTLYPTTLVSSLKKLHTGPITLLKVSGDYLSIVTSGSDKVL